MNYKSHQASSTNNILQCASVKRFAALMLCVVSIGCFSNPKLVSEPPSEEREVVPKVEYDSQSNKGVGSETMVQAESIGYEVTLNIIVTGFEKSEGVCRIAIFLGPDRFNDTEYAVAKELIEINDSRATWQVTLPISVKTGNSHLPLPTLAITAYHDENKNSRLDKSSFGIPIERYGFSNNPKRGFGPPKFSEVAIELKPGSTSLTLEVPILIK